jgi:hypothetical protein
MVQPREESLSNEIDHGPNVGFSRAKQRKFRGRKCSEQDQERQPSSYAASNVAQPISFNTNMEPRIHDSYVAFESTSAQFQGRCIGAFTPTSLDKSMGPRVRDSHDAFNSFSAKPQGQATSPGAWGAIPTASTLDSFDGVDSRVSTFDTNFSSGLCSDPEEAAK